ncbi:MAG: PepSY-like domain-containing protein [Rikenellaceae bacterium]|nr:PepSY-like domain-containing protein [Rikenellaceae bacterium]
MKRVYLLAISIFALLSLNSCDKYDDYSDMMLYSNSEDIKSTVVELYHQARIVEMDKDRRTIEVDIIDSNNIKRDVYLDLSFNWIRTETDISRNALPVEVTDKIAGKYAGWFIDSVKQIDSPQGSYYLVEIEKGERDKYIKIEANGNIL